MSSLRCKLHWHDWNKYGEIVNAYQGLAQFRNCKRCNKVSYTNCFGNQADASDVNETIKKENNENKSMKAE